MRIAAAVIVAAAFGVRATMACSAFAGESPAYVFSASPFEPSFEAPAPGTYELPPIDVVGDHPVVDSTGSTTTLSRIVGGRIAVVSFFYGTCSEKNGCPLATAVLHRLDSRLASGAADVALVSISFDPARDTPERLAAMQAMRAPGSTWSFVTSPDDGPLDALLADFGQTISKLPPGAAPGAAFRHVLKVFLVDRRRAVRNIYSVGFLDPALILADIETLRIEDARRTATDTASPKK